MSTVGPELTVRSESIQTLYHWYLQDRFIVNRRYQRKLVWNVEEKQKLIDSVAKDLPIPLFLVAETKIDRSLQYELIDGMQRLNAIFSFLQNEYSVAERFFDLEALADTKQLRDNGELEQRMPKLERATAVDLANYKVALSVFRSTSSESIDEVFRRINSGGRRLSRQELRQAGTVSDLANLVSKIASRVRGDTSPGNLVALRTMPNLSITNRNLPYGVVVDDIYWVQQGVLRRADLRQSIDEQLVLDLLIDCLVEPLPNSGPDVRDSYYDNSRDLEEGQPSPESLAINNSLEIYSLEKLEAHFMQVHDVIKRVLLKSDQRFTSLIRSGTSGRAPRYYHAVFMAVFELVIRENMQIRDVDEVIRALDNIAGHGTLSTPGGGGDWTSQDKRRAINSVKGNLRDAFEQGTGPQDYSQYGWASRLETILGNALVEQQTFDSKQGVLRLDGSRRVDEELIEKIARTLTAMANAGPGVVSHIAVGVADSREDARRIHDLDQVKYISHRGFYIVGVEREAEVLGKSLNDYWNWLLQKLSSVGSLDSRASQSIQHESRLVNYYGGRAVGLLSVQGQNSPLFFGDDMVDRRGSETVTVQPGPEYNSLYSRFFSVHA